MSKSGKSKNVFYGYLTISLSSTELTEEETHFIMQYKNLIVGIVFFTRNIKSVEQLTDLTQSIRSIKPDMLLFVDNEGMDLNVQPKQGVWRSLDDEQQPIEGFLPPASQYTIAKKYEQSENLGLLDAYHSGRCIAKQLMDLKIIGLSTVLDSNPASTAPWSSSPSATFQSVDGDAPGALKTSSVIDTEFKDSSINHASTWVIAGLGRSFGADREQVLALAQKKIDGMRYEDSKYPIVAKHWPDHGAADGDSHELLPTDSRPISEVLHYADYVYSHLKPVDMIMPCHVVFSGEGSFDADNMVSLSAFWLHRAREQAGKDVIIISDCFSMGAIDKESLVATMCLATNPNRDRHPKLSHADAMTDIVLLCNKSVAELKEVVLNMDHQPHEVCTKRLQKWLAWSLASEKQACETSV